MISKDQDTNLKKLYNCVNDNPDFSLIIKEIQDVIFNINNSKYVYIFFYPNENRFDVDGEFNKSLFVTKFEYNRYKSNKEFDKFTDSSYYKHITNEDLFYDFFRREILCKIKKEFNNLYYIEFEKFQINRGYKDPDLITSEDKVDYIINEITYDASHIYSGDISLTQKENKLLSVKIIDSYILESDTSKFVAYYLNDFNYKLIIDKYIFGTHTYTLAKLLNSIINIHSKKSEMYKKFELYLFNQINDVDDSNDKIRYFTGLMEYMNHSINQLDFDIIKSSYFISANEIQIDNLLIDDLIFYNHNNIKLNLNTILLSYNNINNNLFISSKQLKGINLYIELYKSISDNIDTRLIIKINKIINSAKIKD